MLEAAFWGLVAGFSLLLGAAFGLGVPTSTRTRGLIMGFGSGVLISALAFELTDEAFHLGGADSVAFGLAAGAFTFFAADWAIDRRGGHMRKRSEGHEDEGSPNAIVLGTLLDGIPEAVAIGISILEGGAVGVTIVTAVFIANVPESLSASVGLERRGYSRRYIFGLWTAVMMASAVASSLGYGLLGGASNDVLAVIEAFAAGAILTMLADTMMPEAFEFGGPTVGLATVLGFGSAFLLTTL